MDPNHKGENQVTDEIALQNLWLALRKKAWRVLAVVATTPNGASLEVATALVDLARDEAGENATVLDLRDVKLRLVESEKAHIEQHRTKSGLLVVALSSPDRSPAGLALARAADAAVIVVRLGETPMKTVVRAADEIGRDKVLGAVVVAAAAKAKPAVAPAPKKPAPPPLPSTRPVPTLPAAAAAAATQPIRPSPVIAVGAATVRIAARSGGAKI